MIDETSDDRATVPGRGEDEAYLTTAPTAPTAPIGTAQAPATGQAQAQPTGQVTAQAQATAQAQPHTPAPRRPLGRVRRPQILATAVELLREQGLWSVRVADVAARAGTSPTGVIYYFGTKEELFKAAIADADAEFYASVWPELERLPSAIERLAALLVRSSTSEWVLWMDLWVYSRRHPELLPAQRGFSERWCATITDVVRHGQGTGEFPGDVDAGGVGVRLAALTDGLAVHMVLEDAGRTPAHYVEMALAAAAAELAVDVAVLSAAADRVPAPADPAPRHPDSTDRVPSELL